MSLLFFLQRESAKYLKAKVTRKFINARSKIISFHSKIRSGESQENRHKLLKWVFRLDQVFVCLFQIYFIDSWYALSGGDSYFSPHQSLGDKVILEVGWLSQNSSHHKGWWGRVWSSRSLPAWNANCHSGNVNCVADNFILLLVGEAFRKCASGLFSLLKN